MLKPFGREIWTADGPDVVAMLGFHYPTRTAVIRLSDGDLFIWSPVALTNDLRAAVDALGTVRYLIAPNSLHHVFIADWKRAYPDARTCAAPGLQEKRKDIVFDAVLDSARIADWSEEIEHVLMPNGITSEVVFFHRESGTVIFTDLIQQFPARWFSGWRAIVAKWDLMLGPEPSVPRKFRMAFTNRRAARASLERILEWPAEKVLMAHGTPVTENGQAFIKRAFGWLMA
ncbi:MAG: DUF4336 domain-containing protein [Parvibaculum sp.]|uniref:DUF4336 domain-containing protein n=1 Tax=Parvibaculum sp. TaxID=2024848 RepID=UPI0025CE69C5|nr:DUF4336 domain-containing protein [Parvibaculum sp.]MCE9651133.1 DUF4336 domain-containing protein [Parvibaculum sp.]